MKEALFSWKTFFFRFSCQDTQKDVKIPKKWFRKKVGMDVCVYAKTAENLSFCILGITRPIEGKFAIFSRPSKADAALSK